MTQDIMPISIVTKFGDDRLSIAPVRADEVRFDEFHQLRGHNSQVSLTIWLVIELDPRYYAYKYCDPSLVRI